MHIRMYVRMYAYTVDLEIFVFFFSRKNVFVGQRTPRKYFNFFFPQHVMASAVEDAYRAACCIRGYHVYRDIWAAAVGEVLACEQEPRNRVDRHAVAVKKGVTVIGHLPRKMSRVCSLFLRRGRDIHCTVTGRRQHSSDLPQGGLEIPCIIEFRHSAKPKEIAKLKKLLK